MTPTTFIELEHPIETHARFARKIDSLANIEDIAFHLETTIITHIAVLDTADFAELCQNLLDENDWLAGLGGFAQHRKSILCVDGSNGAAFLVDPSGYNYARYVGRFGKERGRDSLS